MTADEVTLLLRLVNSAMALGSVGLFVAVVTYQSTKIDDSFRTVLVAIACLLGAVAVSSAWRAASGHIVVPSAVLFVALANLCWALARDYKYRRATS